jgi:RNA polymerase sigma-70 factor (ECF subfamily)
VSASGHAAHTPDDALVAFWRDERVIVLAHLVRRARGDVDAAEDALAEAVGRAVPHWRAHGVPERPGAWLLTVARNVLTDRDRTHRGDVVALDDLPLAAPDVVQHVPDDRLALLFTCCHPALAPAAQVCLALRTIGGLTNREIARATLEPEPTVAQRVLRATRKIRDAGIPLDLPAGDAREVRIDVTRQILYLLFNEGYGATSGTDYVREALCETAIALGRQLTALDAEGAESRGLLALMLLHHARRHARLDADGVPITLEEQDRRRWDRALIAE